MAGYYLSAFRTGPFGFFLFQQFLDAVFPDAFQVFDHTQMVLGTVTGIEIFQRDTRKKFTLKTKPNQSLSQGLAMGLQYAGLPALQTTCAVRIVEALRIDVILPGEVADTYGAVHSTGRNKGFFHSYPSFSRIRARHKPKCCFRSRELEVI
jgi:hypothetical protein